MGGSAVQKQYIFETLSWTSAQTILGSARYQPQKFLPACREKTSLLSTIDMESFIVSRPDYRIIRDKRLCRPPFAKILDAARAEACGCPREISSPTADPVDESRQSAPGRARLHEHLPLLLFDAADEQAIDGLPMTSWVGAFPRHSLDGWTGLRIRDSPVWPQKPGFAWAR
jgi:hypothetical protein